MKEAGLFIQLLFTKKEIDHFVKWGDHLHHMVSLFYILQIRKWFSSKFVQMFLIFFQDQ